MATRVSVAKGEVLSARRELSKNENELAEETIAILRHSGLLTKFSTILQYIDSIRDFYEKTQYSKDAIAYKIEIELLHAARIIDNEIIISVRNINDDLQNVANYFGLPVEQVTRILKEEQKNYARSMTAPVTNEADLKGEPATAHFETPLTLQTKHRTKSKDLDALVSDMNHVRAAQRLLSSYNYRRKDVTLSEEEMEQVRRARRVARAYERRQKASLD